MLTSEGSWQTFLTHARQSRPTAPAGLFVSQRTGSHSAGISCTTHELFCPRWFCAVHGTKSPLHRHNWLSFGKFQDTERFLIHCARHFRHDYPLAVEPASTPRPLVQKKTLRDSLTIDMLLSAVSFLVVAQSSSEVPEGLMNNPVQYRVRNFVFRMTCGYISSVNNSERFLLDPPNQVNVKHEVHVINTKKSVTASHNTKCVSTTKIPHSTFILRTVRNISWKSVGIVQCLGKKESLRSVY